MKTALLMFMITISSYSLFTEEYTDEERVTMDTGKLSHLYISNIHGKVTLNPSTNNKIVITITKTLSLDKNIIFEDPHDIFKQVFISKEITSDTIRWIVHYPQNRDLLKRLYQNSPTPISIHFNCWIPSSLTTTVSQLSGEIIAKEFSTKRLNIDSISSQITFDKFTANTEILSISGIVTIQNSDARIKIVNLDGQTTIDDSNGTIQITQNNGKLTLTNFDGELGVKSNTGSIDIQSPHGKIALNTESGMIDISKNAALLSINTIQGNISTTFNEEIFGNHYFDNKLGSTKIALHSKSKTAISTSTVSGKINSTIPLALTKNQRKKVKKGRLNVGGNAAISINSESGEINLSTYSED